MRISLVLTSDVCSGFATFLVAACGQQQPEVATSDDGIAMDGDDIAGVVQSAAGPGTVCRPAVRNR